MWYLACVLLVCLAMATAAPGESAAATMPAAEPPPNAPGTVALDGSRLTLTYHGGAVLEAPVQIRTPQGLRSPAELGVPLLKAAEAKDLQKPHVRLAVAETTGETVTQRISLQLWHCPQDWSLQIEGLIHTSPEGFPAETEDVFKDGLPLVRNVVGLSRSLRNDAVYDRRWDWVLAGPNDGRMRITPALAKATGPIGFAFAAAGQEVSFTFRPRFYQKHKNIRFFEPWTYQPWRGSIAGWCSWWAYRGKITEKDVAEVCDVLAARLKDFGYQYVQIDDGYQTGQGRPDQWLTYNAKFPGGMAGLAKTIRDRGLTPAIWVNVQFTDAAYAAAHKEFFAGSAGSAPYKGRWVHYALDASNPAAVDTIVRPVYSALRKHGFSYVKIDTLRHLLYDAYYPLTGYFREKGLDRDEVFRKYLQAARDELGRETYILACWGVLPEAVGLADGCRLGGDGFGPATLQQYNSWNNVVWRNDPDHCDITPAGQEAIRPVLVSMAGAQLLLTDKPEVYRDDQKIEAAKRSAPVLFCMPGQLYDFDPRKTDNLRLGLRNTAGGSAAGPIDADRQGAVCPWWLLEINRPFESWVVLAHLTYENAGPTRIRLHALGLPRGPEYLVYEFFSRKLLSFDSKDNAVEFPAQQAKEARVYVIRQKLEHPQVLSTSRHITQGGVDLLKVAWENHVLRGESLVVKGDPYALTFHVPGAYKVAGATVAGREVQAETEADLVRVTCVPDRSEKIAWEVRFTSRQP